MWARSSASALTLGSAMTSAAAPSPHARPLPQSRAPESSEHPHGSSTPQSEGTPLRGPAWQLRPSLRGPHHRDPHLTQVGRERRGEVTFESVSSVAQSCLTLCNPMECSTPGLPVHHQLPDFTQTHVHHVGDAIQPSHPLSSPSPPIFNLSQHQGLLR